MTACPKPRQQPRKAKKYVPRVNCRRAAIRRARDFGDLGEWVKTQPCYVSGKRTGEWTDVQPPAGLDRVEVTVVPAHVKGRGAGGRKHANILPLAWHLHQLQTDHGWERIGLTLEKARQAAAEYQDLFDRTFAPTAKGAP